MRNEKRKALAAKDGRARITSSAVLGDRSRHVYGERSASAIRTKDPTLAAALVGIARRPFRETQATATSDAVPIRRGTSWCSFRCSFRRARGRRRGRSLGGGALLCRLLRQLLGQRLAHAPERGARWEGLVRGSHAGRAAGGTRRKSTWLDF